MNRRSFVKALGTIGASTLPLSSATAESINDEEKQVSGVLVDTTRCIGCRNCERACAEAHGLPEPSRTNEVFQQERTTSTTQWTVVNRYRTEEKEVFVKKQCMHCTQPACTSACLTKAMLKSEKGPVIWREGKCMGCRFCMISCPFDMPKFEYDSPIPKIQKCNLCWERVSNEKVPACVEACPAEAIVFGKRTKLLDEARRQIAKDPDRYIHHVYGEMEAGGTGYLYLSAVPFDTIGFRTDVENIAYPEFSKDYLYAVPIILTLWPAFLLALSNATKREEENQ